MPFGESTLALVLSAIALGAVLLPDPRAPLKEINDYLSGTNFAMSATLVDIEIDDASVLVENNENSPAAMNSLQCSLYLPLDRYYRVRDFTQAREDGNDERFERLITQKDSMGIFLITFDLKHPVLVRPYEATVITFTTAHISPPLRPRLERPPDNAVTNFCFVSGSNFEDEFAVGGIIVASEQLTGIDLLDVLERADYGEKREQERELDLSIVRVARANAQASEAADNSP